VETARRSISEVGADIAWRGCLIARYNERMKPKRLTLANGWPARWYRPIGWLRGGRGGGKGPHLRYERFSEGTSVAARQRAKAASALQIRQKETPWLTAVGVGQYDHAESIYLYVKDLKGADLDFLKQGWKGFPVVVQKMGTPRLLAVFEPKVSA
jgi:hypothetical protein